MPNDRKLGYLCQWYPNNGSPNTQFSCPVSSFRYLIVGTESKPFQDPAPPFTDQVESAAFLTYLFELNGHRETGWDESTTVSFNCAEQYMMLAKALLFRDLEAAQSILHTPHPKEQKQFGRGIRGWVDEEWEVVREQVVETGNWYKFNDKRNLALKRMLLATGDRELVEAAGRDRVWGIGFNAKNAMEHRKHWGLNLLGKCLMRVRKRIRESEP